jgi:hypothetical protein
LEQPELGTETLVSVAFDPAEFGIERLQTTGGREKFDRWRFRVGRLVILHKGQVIDPATAFPQPEAGRGGSNMAPQSSKSATPPKGHAIPAGRGKRCGERLALEAHG